MHNKPAESYSIHNFFAVRFAKTLSATGRHFRTLRLLYASIDWTHKVMIQISPTIKTKHTFYGSMQSERSFPSIAKATLFRESNAHNTTHKQNIHTLIRTHRPYELPQHAAARKWGMNPNTNTSDRTRQKKFAPVNTTNHRSID